MIQCIEREYSRHVRRVRSAAGAAVTEAVPMAEVRLAREQAAQAQRADGRRPLQQARPQGVAEHLQVQARVNHGRWVGSCCCCSFTDLVAITDPRFICRAPRCQGGGVNGADGAAQRLVLPPPVQIMQIEALLELRPRLELRNWLPGETPVDLLVQNIALGFDSSPTKLGRIVAQLVPDWTALLGPAAVAELQALPLSAWSL